MSSHGTTAQVKSARIPVPFLARLLLMIGVITTFMIWIFGDFWGVVLTLVVLAVIRPTFLKDVPAYTVLLVLDYFTGKLRIIRQGLHPIAPGESVDREIDLRRHIHDVPTETYPSKAGRMLARYVYSMFPDASSDETIAKYGSIDEDSIKQAARAMISTALSDYFSNRSTDEELLNKQEINKLLFRGPDGKGTQIIRDFERDHGVDIHEVKLEDVDFDEQVQKMRNSVATAKSFREGVAALMANDGLTRESAEKTMRLLGIDNAQEHIITLDARGLENLEHVNIGWVPGSSGKPKGGKK